jgi:hypothetical protein
MLASDGTTADVARALAQFEGYRTALMDTGRLDPADDRMAQEELAEVHGLAGRPEGVSLKMDVTATAKATTSNGGPALGSFVSVVPIAKSVSAAGVAFGLTHAECWTGLTVVRFWVQPATSDPATVELRSESDVARLAPVWHRLSIDDATVRGEVATAPVTGAVVARLAGTSLNIAFDV